MPCVYRSCSVEVIVVPPGALPGHTRPPFSFLRERRLKAVDIRCPIFTACFANATVEPVRLKPTYNDSIFHRIVVESRRLDSVQPPEFRIRDLTIGDPTRCPTTGDSTSRSNHRSFDSHSLWACIIVPILRVVLG